MPREFFNWNDSARSEPGTVACATSIDELKTIVTSPDEFPSPLRVAGSLHSMNECFATTGTQLFLKGEFSKKFRFNPDGTITVGATVTMLEIAQRLRAEGLQLPVMPEIGNATAGSVACCGTKDSSFANGPGQVSSAAVAVDMVLADGTIETTDERNDAANAERLREIRSSYGLFGIIVEVTFRTEPLSIARYTYEIVKLDPLPSLDDIRAGADAVLAAMQPYAGRMIVERRSAVSDGVVSGLDRIRIGARRYIWKRGASRLGTFYEALGMPSRLIDFINRLIGFFFHRLLSGFDASRADCMLDFRKRGPYFDFTFWAFPVSKWPTMVPIFLEFVQKYRSETGFRATIFSEVYFIARDDGNVLSFSHDEDVFTLDLVDHRPNDPLWRRMHREFNIIAARNGGRPLLNQTKELTTCGEAVVCEALGDRWRSIRAIAARDDPEERFMNAFFRSL